MFIKGDVFNRSSDHGTKKQDNYCIDFVVVVVIVVVAVVVAVCCLL